MSEYGAEIPTGGKRPEWLRNEDFTPVIRGRARDFLKAWKPPYTADVFDRWDLVESFYLPAHHPYYLATSKGFTYWPGGEEAPADWDGGEVLFSDGDAEDRPGEVWSWHRGPSSAIIGYKPKAPDTYGSYTQRGVDPNFDGSQIRHGVKVDPVPDYFEAAKRVTDRDAVKDASDNKPIHVDGPVMVLPARWAFWRAEQERAAGLLAEPNPRNVDVTMENPLGWPDIVTLARYIEQHESPPVDPDVLAVREILAAWEKDAYPTAADNVTKGVADEHHAFVDALAAYRRHKVPPT